MGLEDVHTWYSAFGWSLTAAACVTAVMASVALARRAVRRRILALRDRRREYYRAFFSRFLADRRPDQPLPPLPKRILDPAFLDALGEVLDQSPALRVQVTVLCEISGCVATLCRATRSLISRHRVRAAQWLGRIGSRQAIPHVLRLLEDSSSLVRAAAIDGLGSLASFRDAQALQGLFRLLDRLGAAPADAESAGADISLPALASALAAYGAEAIPALIGRLHSAGGGVRVVAAEALAHIADLSPQARPVLVDALRDADPEVRARAAKAVGRSGDVGVLVPLIHALGDGVWFVRLHAARAIGSLGHSRAASALVTALIDESWQVRAAAADALRRLGPVAVETLAETLFVSRDRYAKDQIVEELQRTPILRQQIDALGGEAETMSAAHRFLVEVARHGATTVLIDALRHHANSLVRRRLVSVLGECDTPRVRAVLHDAAAHDPVGDVQDAACRALVGARRSRMTQGQAA